MTNYKNLKFENSMQDFQRWSREFPNIESEYTERKKFHKKGNLYLELNYVERYNSFIDAYTMRIEHSFREFKDDDFVYYNPTDAEKLQFSNKIEKFKKEVKQMNERKIKRDIQLKYPNLLADMDKLKRDLESKYNVHGAYRTDGYEDRYDIIGIMAGDKKSQDREGYIFHNGQFAFFILENDSDSRELI